MNVQAGRSSGAALAVGWASGTAIVASIAATLAAITLATHTGLLAQLALAAAALLALLVGLRWPVLPLLVFVAVIPIEEVVKVGDVGTMSKVAGVAFALTYAVPRLGRLKLAAMPLAGWAYIGWALLSLGWAKSPATSMSELPTLVQLFIVAILIADFVVHRPANVRLILWVYTVSATITSVIGIIAYVLGNFANGARVSAFQDQDVAQFAALLLPAMIFSLHEIARRRVLPISMATALITATGIILSGTRGAWVSSAIIFVLFILPQVRPSRRIGALVLAVLAIVAVIQLPGVADLVAERTALAVSTGGAGRTDIWTVGLRIIESSPLTGVGFANFPLAYSPQFVLDAGVTGYTSASYGPHSILIGTLGELGIVGLLLLASFLVPLIVRRGFGPEATTVRSMLASLAIAALFLDVVSNRKQVWLMIGIAAGLAYLAERRPVIHDAMGMRAAR